MASYSPTLSHAFHSFPNLGARHDDIVSPDRLFVDRARKGIRIRRRLGALRTYMIPV